VPAQSAVIGITDCILTRLVSMDSSTAGGQSTFMIDLRQMAMMIQKATPRSLLIVDEFGKVRAQRVPLSILQCMSQAQPALCIYAWHSCCLMCNWSVFVLAPFHFRESACDESQTHHNYLCAGHLGSRWCWATCCRDAAFLLPRHASQGDCHHAFQRGV
jgi:hypothetical protein